MLLRHPAFSRPHPLTLAILLALGSHAATTQAESNGAAVQRAMFDIPAGPLAQQLNLLAKQAGLLIGGDATLTANKQSQAVHATGVEQALAVKLAAGQAWQRHQRVSLQWRPEHLLAFDAQGLRLESRA